MKKTRTSYIENHALWGSLPSETSFKSTSSGVTSDGPASSACAKTLKGHFDSIDGLDACDYVHAAEDGVASDRLDWTNSPEGGACGAGSVLDSPPPSPRMSSSIPLEDCVDVTGGVFRPSKSACPPLEYS